MHREIERKRTEKERGARGNDPPSPPLKRNQNESIGATRSFLVFFRVLEFPIVLSNTPKRKYVRDTPPLFQITNFS